MLRKALLLASLLMLCGQAWAQPDPYRPWVRWWWNGDKVDTVEIKRELRLLHDAGVGGVEINPIEFPAKRCDSLGIASLRWLSEEWIEALGCALREAQALGMGCDLLVGSGWPFGKEELPMEERAQVMLVKAFRLAEMDTLADGTPYIAWQQIQDAIDPKVTTPNNDRSFELVSLTLAPDSITRIEEAVDMAIPSSDTLVFAHHDPRQAYLYALVRGRSFASVIDGAPGASGAMLDHLNKGAVQRYLYQMSETLEKRLGPMREWLRAYFADSMELEGSNWTDDFAEQFSQRYGYDIVPYLPLILFETGRLGEAVSYQCGAKKSPAVQEQLQRHRYNFESLKAQLFHERYTQTFVDWCHSQGVKARAQAYGRGFYPLESSLDYDIPEGESWTTNYLRHRIGEEMPDEDYRRGRAYTMINKYVSSAAHQAGRRIVSAEEMTNTYRLFETTPELLKLGSDMSAISGTTHTVWHGFNYTPPQAGFPGWVQYGSYYNEQNSWWPYFGLLNEYRARMSALLQNAEMQTDMAIVVPTNEMWGEIGVQTEPFPNYPKGSKYEVPQLLWEAIHKNGGNCDFITPDQETTATYCDGGVQVGQKKYQVLIGIGDSTIEIEDYRPRHTAAHTIGMPTDNNYLDWYGAVQERLGLPHAIAIGQPDRFLLQNHYRSDQGEALYLIVNAHLREGIQTDLAFPKEVYRHCTAWAYDCNTGSRQLIPLSHGRCHLSLGPAESIVVQFTPRNRKLERTAPRRSPYPIDDRQAQTIETPWQVHLQHAILKDGADAVFDTLADLRNTPYADFSGTITYRAEVYLDSAASQAQHLDLGAVYDICALKVNGTDCGIRWFGRRVYDVAGMLRPGKNSIEVKVVTTLNNYVHTLADDKVMQHYIFKRNVPTTPAGLVGAVRLYY